MLKEAVLHIPDSNYAFAMDEKTVALRLRTKKDDILRCTLLYGNRVSQEEPVPMTKVSMFKVGSDELFDYYECKLSCSCKRICYCFLLEDEKEAVYYYSDEFHKSTKCDRTEYYQFAYVRREDTANVPFWAASSIIYQIFPDSFATEKRSVSCKNSIKKYKDGALCVSRNGGTLKGILKNIDYLADLGITCIYLNPVFTASSYHKYDTIDYFSVDPSFGTEEDLKQLVSTCHENNIRVILDGVFNHCGSEFFAFKDVLKNGKKSKYVGWFYHLEFPIRYETPPNYAAFAYVREMPKLNTGNPEVAEYLCNVGTYWIQKADIDGWRLDVANEINHGFWRQFRNKIKSVKPDAFLIAEIWEDSPQWLQGDQFDSTMNYCFSNLCRDFFAKRDMSVEKFDQKINSMLLRYKTPMTYVQMNLLDSHDVPRFLSKCGDDLKKLKLTFFFMMTFIGVPSIFYGDEAGIDGVTEREYRKPMPWGNQPEQSELFKFIKNLISIRKKHEALIYGNFKTVQVDEPGVYAFSRNTSKEKLLVVLNNSDTEKTIKIPLQLSKPIVAAYSDTNTEPGCKYGQTVKIGAMQGKIFEIL